MGGVAAGVWCDDGEILKLQHKMSALRARGWLRPEGASSKALPDPGSRVSSSVSFLFLLRVVLRLASAPYPLAAYHLPRD